MKTPVKTIHIPHALNLSSHNERRFTPPKLGDVYAEDNDTGPLLAFVGLAAVFLIVVAAIFYFTK